MHSTLKNISNKKPTINPNAVCSKYLQYPDETGKREAEGGLRLEGKYKQSLQDKPLITVITVVYNNEETLERCITSVLEQTYDNIEYIVIDGGSNDGTLDIIKKYENSIDYFISEPDQGIYYAMNKGISLASGDYVNFMNSDDWFREDLTISSIVKSTILDLNTIYYGKIMYFKEGKEYRESWEQMVDENILVGYPIPHPSAFVGRNVFNTLDVFDTKYKISADFEWWVRAKINKISFQNIHCIVANYSIGGISSSDDGWDAGQIENMYILLINKIIEPEDLLSPRLKFFNPFKNIDKDSIIQNLTHIKISKENTALIEKSIAPIISIIIPVYNMEKYIQDCLDSLIAQSIFNRLEVICIDDGSNDASAEIINQYTDRYSAVTLIKHNTNLGALAARYTGIQQAQGKYFIFFDSDDLMPVDACEILYREITSKNTDIVMGKMIWKFDENHEFPKKEQVTMPYLKQWHDNTPSKNIRFDTLAAILPLSSKIYKASLVKEALDYDIPKISHGEDICFFIRIFLKSKTFLVTDKTVYWRRRRNSSAISGSSINIVVERVLSLLYMIQQTKVFYLTELEQTIIRSQISYIKEISEKIENTKEKNDAFNIIENLKGALNGDLLKFYNDLKDTYSIKTLNDVFDITQPCLESKKDYADLAPVIIFIYNRVDVLARTISALANNYLAEETDLYIFSDGAKLAKLKDAQKVQEVREFIKTIKGFKSVTIKEQKTNIGLANSVINGINEVSQKHEKFIVLEDDLLTSPFFLKYMNASLKKYKEEQKVWCINGMALNPECLEVPEDYPYDTYFNYRNSSHGWASWSDRWEKAVWDHSQIKYELSDYKQQLLFNRGGDDMYPTMQSQLDGNIDSWEIRWSYSISRHNGVSLSPKYSLVTVQESAEETHIKSYNQLIDNDLSLSLETVTYPDTLEVDQVSDKILHYGNQINVINNCIVYDKQWQFPAITEQHAFRMLCNNKSIHKSDSIYIAFPWATLIDLLNKDIDRSGALLDVLVQIKKKAVGKRNIITVCQHIGMLKYQNIFIAMGITDIFWTHAIKGQYTLPKSQDVNIYPFPLYPVQHDDEHDLNTKRAHLYSFVGARAAKNYLTQSRNFIIDNLSKDTRGLVIGREGWHYENVVYNHQIKQEVVSNSNLVDTASSVEFQDIVKNSIFSLCPSGSGPNSIRLWESIGFGTIPVILADTYLPPGDPALWEEAVVYCKETERDIQKLPELLEQLAKDKPLLTKKRHALNQLWMMYGTNNFVHDIKYLLFSEVKVEETWRKNQQLEQKDTQLKQKDTQLKQKDTQLKKLNSKINTLTNDKWHRFGKLSRKRKIWTIGKVLSKKMKIHWALKPFAQVVKKGMKK